MAKKVRCEACGHTDCKGWQEGQPVHEYRGKGKWNLGCHCENCTQARNESGGFMGALADYLASPSPQSNVLSLKPLEWVEGTYVSTDDDGGPMDGIPVSLKAWRAGPYTIIRQRYEDGLFLLRGKSDGIGLAVALLETAKAGAQADYEARVLSCLSATAPQMKTVGPDGVSLIAAERLRQITEEGWTAEHDDASYHDGELQRAAAAYVLSGMKIYRIPIEDARRMKEIIAGIWPWDEEWFKPVSTIPSVQKYGVGAPIRALVKAGALIAAEIDQQLRRRAAAAPEADHG